MTADEPRATRPPFAYFGGKTSIADRIVSVLPAHRHYVEPFCGSLAVLLAKPPAPTETVNDIDGDLMLFWRVLRDRPEELARAAALTPHSRAEYEASWDRPVDLDDVERARRVWVNLSQSRTGVLRRTGWRFFAKPPGSMPRSLDAYVERMMAGAERLRQVSLECRPGLEVIADYGQHREVLLYVDPPYEGSTRPLTYDGYRHEMRSEADHSALAETLHRCEASVVLSGYRSALYDELFTDAGWWSLEIASYTTQGTAERGSERVEVLWSNRDVGRQGLFAGSVPSRHGCAISEVDRG